MNKSESIKELATALAKAQGEIKGAIKDADNPFFKSKYADLASVVEAIRAAFSKHGLSYSQGCEPSDKNEVRVETIILHASGEWLSNGVLCLPVTKADAQGFGSALTYARRYSLSAAVGVAPEDDDGNAAAGTKDKYGKGIIKPSDGAGDNIDIGRKESLDRLSATITDCFEAGQIQDAMDCLHDITEPDEKVYLWSQLDSKVRSAIKKAQQKAAP